MSADRDGAAVVRVHARPGAARTGIRGRHGDALAVQVTAPPVDGRANVAVAAVLAEALGVPPSAVALVSGGGHRRKRFRVSGPSPEDVSRILAQALAS